MDICFDEQKKEFPCLICNLETSNFSVALLALFFFFLSSPPLLKGWQCDPWTIMNSDLSTEMADSALAIGDNNDKRYPWAFVHMNIVAEAWVQNIDNAEKKNKYLAHNGSFKWHAINYVWQRTSILLCLWMPLILKDLVEGLWSLTYNTSHFNNGMTHIVWVQAHS